MILKNKKLLLGICGSIAAYKSAYLIRQLIQEGATVKVIMTRSATDFVTPLTLSVLSKNPVLTSSFSKKDGTWNNHIELAGWADLLLIAPISANTIAKMANGLCDNLLSAVYLSANCPTMIAPAMDEGMYNHPATKQNIEKLKQHGVKIISPDKGELASGLIGKGRMAEPEAIIRFIKKTSPVKKKEFSRPLLISKGSLAGKKALVTAGPTYEYLDPVRYIGNRSSGKTGFAIAEELAQKGAEVILITGPTQLTINHPNITRIDIITAQEMYNECQKHFKQADITVMSAAIADFAPPLTAKEKIKKNGRALSLNLIRTKDTLAELGKTKKTKQVLIGFALETENEIANAKKKLKNKNLDFIVLNSLNDEKAGFDFDTNKITIISKDGKTEKFELKAKTEVAADIVEHITDILPQ